MKTKFFSLILIVSAIISWGCSNTDDSTPDPTTPPVTEKGEGTKEKPFFVSDVIALNPTSTTEAVKTSVWTKGYVIGFYNTTPNPAVIETAAPFTDDVNIMLAASATETDRSKMLSIQLPLGAVRTALGLKTNPTLIGKQILIYGDVMKYNTFPGVKNTSAYWFVAENTGIEPPTSGDFTVPVMSIADLRKEWTGTKLVLADKKKIVGVVITDLVGGNSGSLKNLTIASEDNSAGIMVRLTEDNKSYNLGDVIEIALEGMELNQYGKAIQLNNIPTVKTRKIGTATVTPKVTTIADIKANYANYESRLVTVTGTITSGGGGTWYSGTNAGQNNKITSGTDELVMYVTKYATFKAETVPSGEKTVTGIVGQYSTDTAITYQLIIRNTSDVK